MQGGVPVEGHRRHTKPPAMPCHAGRRGRLCSAAPHQHHTPRTRCTRAWQPRTQPNPRHGCLLRGLLVSSTAAAATAPHHRHGCHGRRGGRPAGGRTGGQVGRPAGRHASTKAGPHRLAVLKLRCDDVCDHVAPAVAVVHQLRLVHAAVRTRLRCQRAEGERLRRRHDGLPGLVGDLAALFQLLHRVEEATPEAEAHLLVRLRHAWVRRGGVRCAA